jgi:hypothetical protein
LIPASQRGIIGYVTDLLADAVAELYLLDPDEFMARRQDLADQARAAGDPAAAKQITKLRKPTRSAWVVNRLVRTDPDVTARLAALAGELRDAERSPQGARIRELSAARARLVDELTRQALSELPAPPAALREEVTATFDAALADPGVAASLGTLVRAAHWAGFGLNTDGSPAAVATTPAPPAKARKPPPAEASAERERRHREKIMEAERDVAEADRALDAATAAEQQLQDNVRRLETELAQARKQLAEARRQAYRAESRQRRASTTLGRLRE